MTDQFPEATLVELFEEQVVRGGDRVAVSCGGESVSYAELNARANRVARWLLGRGVGVEDLVAVSLPRSVDLVVGLLGVLKAGAAYVPVDPDYPVERREFLLADAAPVCVVDAGVLVAAEGCLAGMWWRGSGGVWWVGGRLRM
ncbi:AMP-binding protein [Streptomyces sp. FXJ1.172]|nr:AMP-binding protein [Streptomyces sp. FXJ1.172]WEO94733.1 AMP-binding protein [Streptomyces sp. FXJ1.172]